MQTAQHNFSVLTPKAVKPVRKQVYFNGSVINGPNAMYSSAAKSTFLLEKCEGRSRWTARLAANARQAPYSLLLLVSGSPELRRCIDDNLRFFPPPLVDSASNDGNQWPSDSAEHWASDLSSSWGSHTTGVGEGVTLTFVFLPRVMARA